MRNSIEQLLEHVTLRDESNRLITARPNIVQLALHIADLYTEECIRMTGSAQRITAANVIHLYKAAQLCKDLGETPEVFVATQLRGMLERNQLWLTALGSPRIHQDSISARNVTLDAVLYYKAQLELFTARSRLYGPVLAVEDDSNDFSPLFRYILAEDLQLPHVAAACRAAARRELLSNPAARDVFGPRTEKLAAASDGADRAPLQSAPSADPEVEIDS
jgi:hypothetical protein